MILISSDLEFKEDPQEEFMVDPQEDPEEEPEEHLEEVPEEASEMKVDDEANWDEEMNEPHLIFPYEEVGSPKPPPPESFDSEMEMTDEGDHVQWHKRKLMAWTYDFYEEMVQAGVVGVRPGEAIDVLVAEAIVEYKRNRTNPKNVGGSGPANAGGVVAPDVYGCSYMTFKNFQPHSFNGTEGVVGLTRWFEKMEQVFETNKCAKEDKVKFVACTCEGRALTWWNRNVRTLGLANANQIPWTYYNNRFHELAFMCHNLVTPEKKKIERYIRGLPENVKENVTSSKLASIHDAINIARELIEQAIHAKATRIGKVIKGNGKSIRGTIVTTITTITIIGSKT
nr:hypothetical protein [Tanacetum cinerariifolium]